MIKKNDRINKRKDYLLVKAFEFIEGNELEKYTTSYDCGIRSGARLMEDILKILGDDDD